MTIFRRGQIAAGLAIVFAAVAIVRYPGGTYLDHSTDGYTAFQNFLSDLGMTVAYDGTSNRLGSACFIASLVLLAIGLGGDLSRGSRASPRRRRRQDHHDRGHRRPSI